MRLTFRIRYHTRPGQSLWLTGHHELFGGGDPARAIPLHYFDEQTWQAQVYIPDAARPDSDLIYDYLLREADASFVHDSGHDRVLNLQRLDYDQVVIIDSWNHPGFVENAFYTEPFQDVLLKSTNAEYPAALPDKITHEFKAKAPLLSSSQTLCLIGSSEKLGNWSTSQPLLLSRTPGEPFLTARLDLTSAAFPIHYKYGVYDLSAKAFVRFEDGPNRVVLEPAAEGQLCLINDGFAALPNATWKGAGVAVPVFSLRSETGFGVGEFSDLRKLADWCVLSGLQLIQILPVNDTTATHSWLDSYPYAAISAFALHPLYVNLNAVAESKSKHLLNEVEPERQRLNALDSVDYEAVMQAKLSLLKELFTLQRDRTFRSKEYKTFFERNRDWLVPYALFCYLRDQYGTSDFTRWPAHRQYVHQAPQPAPAAASPPPNTEGPAKPQPFAPSTPVTADPIAFHYFVQFHLHRQLADAARYAHEKGVILKGDIPIGVYRYGADAWQAPELYQMEMQAGAPPDAFGPKGQNWGFPTYNWAVMKQTGYAWWKRRFEQMSRYFDAFRIDHVLGFFRIWSVPLHAVEGILGRFVPALPVRREEFAQRGLRFDLQRLTSPYITDAALSAIFGTRAETVAENFLTRNENGTYSLRSEFLTQRQVEAFFAELENTSENTLLRDGLFDLISNVILFEEEASDGARFHFRFSIDTTSSFQALDPDTRGRLWDLYVDYYFRRQDEFWRQQGLEKLPALKRATTLLVCGEDLGLVPACVPDVMRDLGLLGLEVQRMPKALNREFSRPQEAPYLSVVTPSTHDMSTLRGWWREDRSLIQRFYNQELNLPGTAPENCEDWVVQRIIEQHLGSPAMWSIFQIQDLLGMDGNWRGTNVEAERINVPANPKNYWRYRLHVPLETLHGAESFNGFLRNLLAKHHRAPAT